MLLVVPCVHQSGVHQSRLLLRPGCPESRAWGLLLLMLLQLVLPVQSFERGLQLCVLQQLLDGCRLGQQQQHSQHKQQGSAARSMQLWIWHR